MLTAPFRFANDDRLLPTVKQTIKSVSADELLNQILYYAINHKLIGRPTRNIDPYQFYKSEYGYDVINEILENKISEDDIKYVNGFDYLYMDLSTIDRYDTYPNDTNLLGLHTLSNGFSFIGCMTGLYDTCGSFVALYHDGTQFRIWEPVRGNTVNYDQLHSPLPMPADICAARKQFQTYSYYPKSITADIPDEYAIQFCLLIRYYRTQHLWHANIAKTADYDLDLAFSMANALRYGCKNHLYFPLYHNAMKEEMETEIQII